MKRTQRPLQINLFALCLLMIGSTQRAEADTLYWDGTGNDWGTAAFWSTVDNSDTPDPGAAPGSADLAVFNITTVNTDQTINLNSTQSAMGLEFNSTGTVLIQGGSGDQTLNLGTSGITANANAGAATIGSDTAGQNVDISLQGAQTWDGSGAGALTIVNGVSIGAGGDQTLTLAGANAANTISGVIADGDSTLSITKSGAAASRWILTGDNTYTGLTTVSEGGLIVDHDNALGSTDGGTTVEFGAFVSLADGITVTGETISLNGHGGGGTAGNFLGSLQAAAGATATWAGDVIIDGTTANTRVGTRSGGTLIISGAIQDGDDTSLEIRNQDNTDAVIISGTSNTYTGQTEIFRGFLKIGADDALPTGNVLDVGASNAAADIATFDLNGFNQTVADLVHEGTLSTSIVTNTGALKTLTVNQGAAIDTTYNGTITGTLALTKSGNNDSSWTLTGDNSYTGETAVSVGGLIVGHNNALGSTDGGTSVASGAFLSLADGITVSGETLTIAGNGGNNLAGAFVGALQTDGAATWEGTINLDPGARVGTRSGGTLTLSGAIQDGGGTEIEIRSANNNDAVIISGTSNTYTGETEIFRGFLKIGADDALPTGNVLDVGANDNIVNGFNDTATFDLNGFNQTIAELKSDGIGNRIVTNTGALKTLTVNQSTNTTFGGDITTDSNTTSGQIEGALALTKSNTGTLTLAGVNTYTGDTTVSGGTLALSATGSIDDSASIQLGVDGTFDVSAIATYAMAGSQPFTFDLDGSGAGSAGFLDAAGLDISAAVVNFNILSALDDLAYILAGYTELTGAQFASVTEPAGYVLDYNYLDGNQIALVQQTVIPTPAALPAGLILLALTAMRRRRD